jgi:DNA-binding CsgD family transcriptional regulator
MSRHSITNPAQRIALTDRQEDVLKLVSRGLTNAEIAERLGVTLDGVKWHIREILGKFGVESREQAVARWREENGVTQRARHWAGALWGSMALRWGGGLVVAGTGAAAGVAVAWAVVQQPPQPVSKDGSELQSIEAPRPLSLEVQGAQTDQKRLDLTVWVWGETDLGEVVAPEPSSVAITDDSGHVYRVTDVRRNGENSRSLDISADVSGPAAARLHLQVQKLEFMPRGSSAMQMVERAGPWSADIATLQTLDSLELTPQSAPQTFGFAAADLLRVRQTPTRTIVWLKFVWPEGVNSLPSTPQFQMTSPSGREIHQLAMIWQRPDELELQFERVTGPVTLRIDGLSDGLTSTTRVVAGNGIEADSASWPSLDELREARAKFVALMDAQPAPAWSFVAP